MQYQSYDNPLTLMDILASILRYKKRAAFVTLMMLGLVVLGVAIYPKRFQSEAKLFVRLGRGSASMDPATFGQTISIQESRETEMNSIQDMLASRALAEAVVADIGAERILEKVSWLEKGLELPAGAAAAALDPLWAAFEGEEDVDAGDGVNISEQKRFELAIKEVQSNLHIDSPKRSTTLEVAYRAPQPQLAKDVVESVITNYGKMHIKAYRSQGTLDFFDEQFTEQESIVAKLEDELRQSKNANDVVTMRGKQEQLQSEITDVKKMQLQARADLQGTLARVTGLEEMIEALDKEVVSQTTSGIASNATDGMRSRLYELEIEEKELASKYVSTDPRLQRVRDQIASTRAIFDSQPSERPQSVMAANPVRQQMENELLLAKSSAAALDAKNNALQQLEAELLERLNSVNDLEVISEDMERRIAIARENHRSYALKQEESRINAALDAQSLSNVSIIGEPTLRYKHVSPKRSLLAAVGGCFSVFCGVLVALLSDYRRNTREMSVIREAEREAYLRHLQSSEIGGQSTSQAHALAAAPRHLVSAGSRDDAGERNGALHKPAEDDAHPQRQQDEADDAPKKAK